MDELGIVSAIGILCFSLLGAGVIASGKAAGIYQPLKSWKGILFGMLVFVMLWQFERWEFHRGQRATIESRR